MDSSHPSAACGNRTVVVVAFAEELSALEVVWSLIDDSFEVPGVIRRGMRGMPAALAHSRLVTLREIPPPESEVESARRDLVDALDDIRRQGQYARHVLLPLDDTAVWLSSCAAQEAGWLFAGPGEAEGQALALDKRRQIETARAVGLDVPATVIANSPADLQELPFGFPIILRPAEAIRLDSGRIGKGRNWICNDSDELATAVHGWGCRGAMLVQPYIEGTGEGVFGLMTETGVLGWSAHRRLRMMNPHGSGLSACISRKVEEAEKAPIVAFLRSARWRGMFMVELLRDTGGRLNFVEFNGRAWGSMALARRLGFEYPAWTVRLALGESTPTAASLPAPRVGVVCRNLGRELMHLLFVLRGRRSRAMRRWPSFWASLRDILRPHPGGSFYNWRGNDWRVFASDCYYTILRNVSKPGCT